MQIEYLANCPHWIPTVAEWIYDEWGKFDPENTLRNNQERLATRLNTNSIPMTLIALDNDRPVGCVSLKTQGMKTHPELSPWIGSLFVVTDYRNQGIGSALLKRALEAAKDIDVSKIYLWTEVASDFYLRFGFEIIEEKRYLDQDAKLMVCELTE